MCDLFLYFTYVQNFNPFWSTIQSDFSQCHLHHTYPSSTDPAIPPCGPRLLKLSSKSKYTTMGTRRPSWFPGNPCRYPIDSLPNGVSWLPKRYWKWASSWAVTLASWQETDTSILKFFLVALALDVRWYCTI